jgi:para-nitrobenzyl esterase
MPVETVGGWVVGRRVDAPHGLGPVERFLGIPFAAPPTGARRWRAPAPVVPWPGVRTCDDFGRAAPQGASLPTRLPGFAATDTDEDCLTLNVWTPATAGRRPVLVWLHGGAYTSGSAAQPVYDAARLAAEQDVVVVTAAYRLGALGYLALPGADANCGLRDQRAAIEWVGEHAAAFGGDPERVTLVGESAGAGSILHLLASPHGPGGARRAIAQSGEPRTLTAEQGEMVAASVARSLGLDRPDAESMRRLPAAAIIDAQAATAMELVASIGLMPYGPVLDGDVCDTGVLDAFAAGRTDAVDLVVGTTRHELRLFPDPSAAGLDDARLERRIARLAPDVDPRAVVDDLRARLDGSSTPADVWDAARTELLMRAPNLELARVRVARGQAPTFVYRFDWEAPAIGAAHGVDIPFTFGTFDREGWGEIVGADEDADALGRAWRGAWGTFAATGTPVVGADTSWEPYDDDRRTLHFTASGCVESREPPPIGVRTGGSARDDPEQAVGL